MKRYFAILIAYGIGTIALGGGLVYFSVHTQELNNLRITSIAHGLDDVSTVAVQARDGVNGINGSNGLQGAQGVPGVAVPGPSGPVGPTGLTGATGQQGPPGDKGDTGAQGAQGDPGPSVEMRCNPDNNYVEYRNEGDWGWTQLYQVPSCGTN